MPNAVLREAKRNAAAGGAAESVHVYHETGAQFADLPGFRLVRAAGLEHVPGGCLVQRADTTAAETDPKGWMETCESALSRAGAVVYHAIVAGESRRLEAQMTAAGYTRRVTTLFASTGAPPASPARVRLQPVTTWPEWNLRCLAERDAYRGEGGHRGDPFLHDELLRRKWVTGKLGFFLIESEGRYCGSMGALYTKGPTRICDIAIRPEWRGRGLAESAIHALWRMALEEGSPGIAAAGRSAEACHHLCQAAGLTAVGSISEYLRRPGAPAC